MNSDYPKPEANVHSVPGHDRLWHWFGLSRASFLVLPRSFMHQMPDEWQWQMAKLLEEACATFPVDVAESITVQRKMDNRFAKWPEYVLNYRHPQVDAINQHRSPDERYRRNLGK
jgi:hypothetical protein